ncbi:MAG TPA: helix-turn-helix domain-containing protein [Wenzhouxiangella sp.]|nr:helix-turn-helix domain-containing protein [Wenzhouxiangella sp.]
MGKLNGSGPYLRELVRSTVEQYLNDMGETPPDNLYEILITEVEKPLIQTVLHRTGGNQSRSAQILGITRATLRNRIQRYDIDLQS